ncbi:MAG: alkaline phosphatase [Dehalococcoidales bacterium]|nr:alkaline phosphatase [Dehalococcoidales bacterium]
MSKFWKIGFSTLVVLILVLSLFGACTSEETTPATVTTTATTTATVTSPPTTITATPITPPPAKAKYIFYFIGDGFGIAERNAAEIYLYSLGYSTTDYSELDKVQLTMSQFPAQGMSTTYSTDSAITDSAAAGTALACGQKTADGVVAMDPGMTVEYKTIAEVAHEAGMKVGIVTSVSLDHATPACFYAHNPSRKDYYGLSMDLVESGFEFFGGGGFSYPAGKAGDQPSVFDVAAANGYTVVDNTADFHSLAPGVGKVIAINQRLIIEDGVCPALPYEIDRQEGELTLADYTAKAIELLDNPDGFFMMVEGGEIDWLCHYNDAASAILQVIAFDKAIDEAVAFYEQHPDETLIVMACDHECGGMTIGYRGTYYDSFFDKIQYQTASTYTFTQRLAEYKAANPEGFTLQDLYPLIEEIYGLEVGTDSDLALQDWEIEMLEFAFPFSMMSLGQRMGDPTCQRLWYAFDPIGVECTHILNQKAGIGWTSHVHTGIPTPVSAIGVGADLFTGYYDNIEIPVKILSIAGLSFN